MAYSMLFILLLRIFALTWADDILCTGSTCEEIPKQARTLIQRKNKLTSKTDQDSVENVESTSAHEDIVNDIGDNAADVGNKAAVESTNLTPHKVRMKCFVAQKNQQASGAVSTTQYGSFKWARMFGDQRRLNGKRLEFEGTVQPLSGLFQLNDWNDEYNRPLNEKTLAQACQQSIDDRGSEGAFFLFARTGCLDKMEIGGIAGQQGHFNKCREWPTSGGPFISFNSVPAHHTWVTLGDSLSDFGGNQGLWYRMGLGHSPWYPAQWSNGPIWQIWLSKGLRKKWGVPGVTDVLSPYEGFTSFACGGAVASQIDGPEKGGFMDRLKKAAVDPLLGDVYDQLHWRDVWSQKYEDPFGIATSEKCGENDFKGVDSSARSVSSMTTCSKSGGRRAMCVRGACNHNKSECAHYTCTCNKGYVNRGNTCRLSKDLQDMPVLEQGGPFAFVWLGANDLNFPARLSTHADYLNPSCEGYHCAKESADRAVNSIEESLDALLARGFRNFAVANLPDLGVTPSNIGATFDNLHGLFEDIEDEKERLARARLYRSQRITNITDYYNVEFKKRVDEWKEKNGVTMAFVDISTALSEITNNKLALPDNTVENYDYPLDLDRFQWLDGGDAGKVKVWEECFPSMLGWGLGKASKICDNQDKAVFWDGVHPTTRVHCWIGYYWHLALSKTGKWDAPDVEGYKNMCGNTRAWFGHVVK